MCSDHAHQFAFSLPAGDLWARYWYQRKNLEYDLRRAVQQRELEVHYQPQVDLVSGMVRGVEALLRWRHPVLGLILPAVLLPLAEELGVLIDMGHWIVDEVCRQAEEWMEPGFDVPIAVNLSGQELIRSNLLAGLLATIGCHGIPPKAIELEWTGPPGFVDRTETVRRLACLREHGFRIALDNVGSTEFEPSTLRGLPLDTVKLDPSLIRTIDCDDRTRCLARDVIELARQSDWETVAVGVEREAQVNVLRELGCGAGQGRYYTEPGPIHHLEYWMEGKV